MGKPSLGFCATNRPCNKGIHIMKVLFFGDADNTSAPRVSLPFSRANGSVVDRITLTFQESQAILNDRIVHLRSLVAMRKPYDYHTSMDAVIADLAGCERMLAAIETSPFELTIVRDAKTLLEETAFEDWLVILIDMEHPQAREVIPQLAMRRIPLNFEVLAIVKTSQMAHDNVHLAESYGCRRWWFFEHPVTLLIYLSKLLG